MRVHAALPWAVVVMWFATGGLPAAIGHDPPPPAPVEADARPTLESLHAEAAQARKARDFNTVESLRKQRLALLREAAAGDAPDSPWTAGIKALAAADELVKKMKYAEACAVLSAAWKPFEQPARDEPVLGDIALQLFATIEAAKAAYPQFNAVSPDQLRAALQRAVESDPCQVEAFVAAAFLTPPDPTEAFAPARERPSLRTRSKLISQSLPAVNHFAKPLPWHAPAEFLKADGNSFVLGDLDFYHRFLDPARALEGVDRDGRPVYVVMGGGLLTVEPDATSTRRLAVYDYDKAVGKWIRMTPRILRVQPADYKPSTWRIDEDQLNADLRQVMADAIAERQTLIKRKLLVTAEGLQGTIRIKADLRKMFWYFDQPPKNGAPITFDSLFQSVNAGFTNYALANPDEGPKVAAAQQQVMKLGEDWTAFKASLEALRSAIGDAAAPGMVEPGKAATALADFLEAIGAASQDYRDFLDSAAEVEGNPKAKPAGKAKAAKPLDASAPIKLAGQELRAEMSKQRAHYNLLALFKLMASVHRSAIASVANPPAPQQPVGPDAPPPLPEDRARAAARQRLKATLEDYDRLMGVAPPAPAAAGPAATPAADYSLTLDELLAAQATLRDMRAVLLALGPESEQTRFLNTFADTIEAVARPAVYEADMQRFCTKANRGAAWQVGRASWRAYDFPATTSPQTVADMIAHCQRVAFSTADLDTVMKDATDNLPPADASIPLRAGCTTAARNRLVHNRNGSLSLQFVTSLTDPCTVLLLDVASTGTAAPACLAAGEGPPFFIVIDGERLPATVATESKTKPQIIIDFAGPLGRVPLGAKADPAAVIRFITDSRGNRIVREPKPVTSLVDSHFYEMTSKAGDPVTDRSLNYALQDWLDLDREMVNVFLPNTMRLMPTLPTWHRYRREFMRPAPDTGWMWPAPKPPAVPQP